MLETLVQNGSAIEAAGAPATASFKTSLGFKAQAPVVRLAPQSVTFELSAPDAILRVSELLSEFELSSGSLSVYNGKAVVTAMLHTGTALACEVALSSPLFELDSLRPSSPEHISSSGFKGFLHSWQKHYRLSPDYKIVIADLDSFLSSLRLWLEQTELSFQSCPAEDRPRMADETAQALRPKVTSALASMFEHFEAIADDIEPHLQPAHRSFGQRHLHPHLLCAPFIYRTYAKPLGFAGDYEMMNMIFGNRLEGSSLYAKLANAFLLDQIGPQAVRNRADYLHARIIDETARASRLGRKAVIYNIACGPAREVETFLGEHPLANQAEFHLLDFNTETLDFARSRMEQVKRRRHLATRVTLVRKSVQHMLRSDGGAVPENQGYDLIYCSGLYDYLNDRVVKALNNYLYNHLRPGGLLAIGNFAPNMPVRNFIEHFLEWFLIYRDAAQLAALAPEQAPPGSCRVVAEPTSTNLFLEVRKPL